MFDGAFSFQGRIGRLHYFLNGLIVGPLVAVALVVGGVVVAAQPTVGNVLIFGALIVAIAIAVIWYSLSLQVRRIRDIGWSPALVLFGYFFLEVADRLVARQNPSLAIGGHHGGTAFGLLVALALTLVLLFWPSEGSGNLDDTPEMQPPVPPRRELAGVELSSLDVAPRYAPALPMPAARPGQVARKQFGKRGLR